MAVWRGIVTGGHVDFIKPLTVFPSGELGYTAETCYRATCLKGTSGSAGPPRFSYKRPNMDYCFRSQNLAGRSIAILIVRARSIMSSIQPDEVRRVGE